MRRVVKICVTFFISSIDLLSDNLTILYYQHKIVYLIMFDQLFQRVQQIEVVIFDVELHVVPVVHSDATLKIYKLLLLATGSSPNTRCTCKCFLIAFSNTIGVPRIHSQLFTNAKSLIEYGQDNQMDNKQTSDRVSISPSPLATPSIWTSLLWPGRRLVLQL